MTHGSIRQVRSVLNDTLARLLVASFAFTAMVFVTPRAHAETILVNSSDDEFANTDGDCSIREALEAAQYDTQVDECAAGSGADEIVLGARTIVLDQGIGQLQLTSDVHLIGAGRDQTILDGAGAYKVLEVFASVTAQVSDLTIQNGAQYPGSAISIDWFSSVLLERVLVRNNGGLDVTHGGIYSEGNDLTILDSEFTGNVGSVSNGLYTLGTTTIIRRSLFTDNGSGSSAPVILLNHDATLENVTVSGNDQPAEPTTSCGGVHVAKGNVTISSSTLYGNPGNNLLQTGSALECTVLVKSSIVAGSLTGSHIMGTFTSDGNNVLGNIFGAGPSATGFSLSEVHVDFTLPSLADNGGPTRTHLPEASSVAIDAGSCTNAAGDPLTVDQRGYARPTTGCDVGAVEYGAVLSIPTLSEWGMIIMGLVLAATMLWSQTRHRRPLNAE